MTKARRPARTFDAPRIPPAARRALLARGWAITSHGNIDAGQRVGDCARCGVATVRYGPLGQPLCPSCRHRKEVY